MKRLAYLIAALLLAVSIASCAVAQGLSTNVQAVFYQWYRSTAYDYYWRHWDGSQHVPPDDVSACFYPYLGAYSSADPVVVEKQMEWLKRAGVGYVLLDVWNTGSYEETPTLGSLDAAAAKGIRCGFYLEPWSHEDGTQRSIVDVYHQIQYLYETYGDHAAAGKVSRATKWGPSTAPRLIMEGFCDFIGITSAEWAVLMDSIRNTPYDVLYLGGGDPTFMDAAHWDGLNSYDAFFNPSNYVSQNNDITSRGCIWAASVAPGFDNTCSDGTLVQSRENGARYDAMWNGLRGANPEFAQIVTFNEWHESSHIEPAIPKTIPGRTYQDFGSLSPFYYLDRTMYWKNQWKGTVNDNAAYMADTIPSVMEAGETRNVTIVMMNTGDVTWTEASEYKLGGYGDSDPFADTRHNLNASDSIGPFECRSFTFPFTAPSTPGTYHTDWQMVHELVRWFGDIRPYKDITVFAAGAADSAECVADTIPDEMIKGQQYPVSVTMRNTGTTTWTGVGTYSLYAVDHSDRFATSGGYTLSAGESIPPGGAKTFTFTMSTPPFAGYYSTDWRMSRTGTGWFGREFKKIILVKDPGSIPPVESFQASPGNGKMALGWTNPSDWDLTRVMVRYKTTGFPTDENDGILLVDKPCKPEQGDAYVHTGLTNGVTYYYAAFAHDGLKDYSVTSQTVATPWNVPTQNVSASSFASDADGWSTAIWRAGNYSYGTMGWNSTVGNPGGAMRSTGANSTDDNDRCKREGGEMSRVISTVG